MTHSEQVPLIVDLDGTLHASDLSWKLFASAALGVTIIGFNLLGDGLRDLLDPRIRDKW